MPECWGCQVRPHEAEKCERLSGVFKTWQQHHVIPQQTLKREGLAHTLGDGRNMVWMREYHHGALEGRVGLRAHFEQVPTVALEFAHEHGLQHVIERLYPSAVSIVSGHVPSSPTEFEEALRLLSELAVTPASDVEGDEIQEERWSP